LKETGNLLKHSLGILHSSLLGADVKDVADATDNDETLQRHGTNITATATRHSLGDNLSAN